jgi:hypothetical protein
MQAVPGDVGAIAWPSTQGTAVKVSIGPVQRSKNGGVEWLRTRIPMREMADRYQRVSVPMKWGMRGQQSQPCGITMILWWNMGRKRPGARTALGGQQSLSLYRDRTSGLERAPAALVGVFICAPGCRGYAGLVEFLEVLPCPTINQSAPRCPPSRSDHSRYGPWTGRCSACRDLSGLLFPRVVVIWREDDAGSLLAVSQITALEFDK